MKLIFEPLHNEVIPPIYMHTNDIGADIVAYADIDINPGKNVIPLGFKCILPTGLAGFVTLRSSWMANGIICNTVPIDPQYAGEWRLLVYNATNQTIHIPKGDRISQVYFVHTEQCDFISESEYSKSLRGNLGVGSTGA